jgi:hypothetical protein
MIEPFRDRRDVGKLGLKGLQSLDRPLELSRLQKPLGGVYAALNLLLRVASGNCLGDGGQQFGGFGVRRFTLNRIEQLGASLRQALIVQKAAGLA